MRIEIDDDTLSIIHARPEDMKSFKWPPGIKSVIVNGDYLDELVIPEGVDYLICENLGLRKLILPSTIEDIMANGNSLLELEVPNTVTRVELSRNPLFELKFIGGQPTRLGYLEVNETNISHLSFYVKEGCFINANLCQYLTHLTPETAHAIRITDPEILKDHPRWIISGL